MGAAQPAMAPDNASFHRCHGTDFVAGAVREWIPAVGARTACIEPGSPWANGFVESFNSKPREERPDGESFYSLKAAQNLIEAGRRRYNAIRPHSAPGWLPTAPEVPLRGPMLWPARTPSDGMTDNAATHPHSHRAPEGGPAKRRALRVA